jgi:signal transduction histidine kinase
MREDVFMGALIASVSHELLNVLATIHQSSGLMDDLMGAGARKSLFGLGMKTEFVHHDKFKSIIATIGQQVDRGMALSEALNTLGHAPEQGPQAQCELWEAASATLCLAERLSRKRRVRFMLRKPQTRVLAGLGQLWAMMAIYEAMETILAAIKETEVEITIEKASAGPLMRFETNSAGLDLAAREMALCGLVVRLETTGNGLALVFPPEESAT